MPYTEEGKAVMLWGLASAISHVSLHNGEPTAENELSGGVYRRKQVDFRDPNGGAIRTVREIEFDIPAGARVTHAGFWTTSIGGVLLAWGLAEGHTFTGRGKYEIQLAVADLNQ